MKVIRAHTHRLAAQPALFPFFVSPFEKSSLRMGNLSINEVPTEMVTLLHFPASLRVSACVTFCPRRVENVRISVLPVCKYKRCCIQYTNALRSGRKFGLEFFPLHSEHPHQSHHITPNASIRVKLRRRRPRRFKHTNNEIQRRRSSRVTAKRRTPDADHRRSQSSKRSGSQIQNPP